MNKIPILTAEMVQSWYVVERNNSQAVRAIADGVTSVIETAHKVMLEAKAEELDRVLAMREGFRQRIAALEKVVVLANKLQADMLMRARMKGPNEPVACSNGIWCDLSDAIEDANDPAGAEARHSARINAMTQALMTSFGAKPPTQVDGSENG